MTLIERIATVDSFMARKFSRLNDQARMLAAEGIRRFIDACDRHGVEPDSCALREIIEDAEDGRQIWKETDVQARRAASTRTPVGERATR